MHKAFQIFDSERSTSEILERAIHHEPGVLQVVFACYETDMP